MIRRLREARFEGQATLEALDFIASPKLPAVQISDLAALRWLRTGESVILYGLGVRKSHIRQDLTHLALPIHTEPCRFTSAYAQNDAIMQTLSDWHDANGHGLTIRKPLPGSYA